MTQMVIQAESSAQLAKVREMLSGISGITITMPQGEATRKEPWMLAMDESIEDMRAGRVTVIDDFDAYYKELEAYVQDCHNQQV